LTRVHGALLPREQAGQLDLSPERVIPAVEKFELAADLGYFLS